MVAKVRTNRVFDGRMYGKSRPNSCTVDVRSSLDFELYLGFNDINCDVRQEIPGKYASDVIIQVCCILHNFIMGKNHFLKSHFELFTFICPKGPELGGFGAGPGPAPTARLRRWPFGPVPQAEVPV